MIYTDVEDLSTALKVYPNPVTDLLQVHVPETNIERRFIIMDLSGKVIVDRSSTNAAETFNISDLKRGLYVIPLISGQKKSIQLFVKN